MEERLVCFYIILPGHSSSSREVRAGTQGWHLGKIKQRPWRNIAYCLAQLAFSHNPGALAQRHHQEQWAGPSHIKHPSRKYSPSHTTTTSTICLQTIWWRQILILGSFFPGDSRLCQVDKTKQTSLSHKKEKKSKNQKSRAIQVWVVPLKLLLTLCWEF